MKEQGIKDWFFKKTLNFVNMKGVLALKEGMLATLPLTIAGSIFLVIGQFPSETVNNFIAGILGEGWQAPFMQVHGGTFAIMGLVACFAIAYEYARLEKQEPLPAGVLSLAAFFITLRSEFTFDEGLTIEGVMDKVWFGGQGIVAAIIIGLLVGYIYSFLLKNDVVIKMPDTVPEGVSNQFKALVPAIFILLISMIVYVVFDKVAGKTFVEWIYSVIQAPLQGLTDSLPGVIGIAFFISFFWWFGVHGQSIVNGVVTALLTANAMSNADMLISSGQLTVEGGAHIVTQQFLDSFIILSGSGITFGLVTAMLFAAKSEQYKSLGKASILPAMFNINEPVTFGFPIVLNPMMFIPFILVPVLAAILVYASIALGFVTPFSGVLLPWSTPLLISGLLVAGWKGVILQLLILLISIIVYYPFFKKQDAIAYQREQGIDVQTDKNN